MASDTSSFRARAREAPSKVVLCGGRGWAATPRAPRGRPAMLPGAQPQAAGQVKVSSPPRFFAAHYSHEDGPAARGGTASIGTWGPRRRLREPCSELPIGPEGPPSPSVDRVGVTQTTTPLRRHRGGA